MLTADAEWRSDLGGMCRRNYNTYLSGLATKWPTRKKKKKLSRTRASAVSTDRLAYVVCRTSGQGRGEKSGSGSNGNKQTVAQHTRFALPRVGFVCAALRGRGQLRELTTSRQSGRIRWLVGGPPAVLEQVGVVQWARLLNLNDQAGGKGVDSGLPVRRGPWDEVVQAGGRCWADHPPSSWGVAAAGNGTEIIRRTSSSMGMGMGSGWSSTALPCRNGPY